MRGRLRAMLVGAAGVAIFATQAAPARAGLRIELDVSERGASAAAPERWIVWIDGTRLASEPARREGSARSRRAIFRGAEDVMWLVDPAQRSYFQLDPKSAEATAAQLARLRNGVAQGFELLSPEQREGMKELFGDLATAPPDALPALRLRAGGEPARHAGLPCTRHDVLEGERRVAELCLAAWGTGPLTRERAAALPALMSFLRRTLAPLSREVASLRPIAPLASLGSIDGFPLAARAAQPGGSVREIAVVRVEEHAVDPGRFELPAGYARSLVPPFE